MELPVITPTHDHLAALVGGWRGREERAASLWAEGGPADATLDFRLAAEGFVLVEDYVSRCDGRLDLSGHGVFSALKRNTSRGTTARLGSLRAGELHQMVEFRSPEGGDFSVLLHGRYMRYA